MNADQRGLCLMVAGVLRPLLSRASSSTVKPSMLPKLDYVLVQEQAMPKRLRFRRFAIALDKDQKGSGLIETAITFFLVVIVVFGTIEFSSLVYTYTVLADAANEGLRYAIVHSTSTTGATAVVKQYASYSLHDTSKINVTVNCASTCAPPDTVTITVSYTYVPYLSNIMANPPTMNAYAQGVTEY